ncbi:HD domain-containing protein [Candidatus Woesearchaeota archaeon]|nr:HD domain-containing protein [Candidatus Woesearchaeota archaeon]
MKLNKKLEEKLKARVLVHLKNGRRGWDVQHTLAAVYYMRKLIEKEGGNEKILVTAMYLHDIGYPQFDKKYTFDEVMKSKPEHSIIGAEKAEKILNELDYTADEIKKIVHLVKIHDELTKISTADEIKVMEADSLGMIDWEMVSITYDKESIIKFMEYFERERVPRFKTKTGKKLLKKLFKKAEEYTLKM